MAEPWRTLGEWLLGSGGLLTGLVALWRGAKDRGALEEKVKAMGEKIEEVGKNCGEHEERLNRGNADFVAIRTELKTNTEAVVKLAGKQDSMKESLDRLLGRLEGFFGGGRRPGGGDPP
jgi:hypothetical protein